MRKKLYKLTKLIGLTIVIALFCLIISYQQAKNKAVEYLQIVTIHNEESFQRVKKEINHIVSPEVRRTLFDKEKYEGPKNPISYKVNNVNGYVKGFNHFVFKVNWTSNGYYTIDSKIYIKDGIVYDTYRID